MYFVVFGLFVRGSVEGIVTKVNNKQILVASAQRPFTNSSKIVEEVENISLTKLKIRQPNWKLEILEKYSDGSPKIVLLLEPGKDKTVPVKLLHYTASGLLYNESDLLALDNDGNNFNLEMRLESEFNQDPLYVYHGPSVYYDGAGAVEMIVFYKWGVLHDSIKIYYPNGLLKSFVGIKDGRLEGLAEKHFENGEIAEKMHFVKGQLSGIFERFHLNGIRTMLSFYHEGVLEGEVKEWTNDGKLQGTYHYSKGLLSGNQTNKAFRRYYSNGMVLEERDFCQGQPWGLHFRNYQSGQKSYVAHYEKGKKHGREQYFNESGEEIGSGEYLFGKPIGKHELFSPEKTLINTVLFDKQGIQIKPFVEYHKNGAKKAQYFHAEGHLNGEYLEWYSKGVLKRRYEYDKGEFEGLQQEFFDSGILKLRVSYQNGIKHGLYEEWHESEKLAVRIAIDQGLRNGASQTWHPNGLKAIDSTYQQGKLDGPYQEWHINGIQKFYGDYVAGKRQGQHREWNDGEVLIVEAQYKDDILQGQFRHWYANGTLKHSAQYMEGKLENNVEEFYENGKPASLKHYLDGRLDGECLCWYEDGEPQEVRSYKQGQPIGAHIIYYPVEKNLSQQISHEINYQAGKLHGEQKSFYPDGTLKAVMNYSQGLLHGHRSILKVILMGDIIYAKVMGEKLFINIKITS